MKLKILKKLVYPLALGLALEATLGNVSQAAQAVDVQRNNDVKLIISAQAKINSEGFEQAMAESSWPEVQQVDLTNEHQEDFNLALLGAQDQDLPWDICNFDPTASGCSPYYSGGSTVDAQAYQLKDDAVQILATEVLYQTLLYFKVKNVFGKIPNKGNTYGFKVIDPVDGQPYQDLDSDTVIYAVKQFRKYIIGLLCNQPNPMRILAMMKAYDVGTRFRWDMAWALLGNDLPDSPNKYMTFGVKWRKFSTALDGIENGSIMRLRTSNGGYTEIGGVTTPAAAGGANIAKAGFIAKEAVGVIRLVGDIISATLDLFCVSDLSVDQKKEQQKQDVVYKLLEVKKKAYDRYGPLRPILEEMGKKATEKAGMPITVFP